MPNPVGSIGLVLALAACSTTPERSRAPTTSPPGPARRAHTLKSPLRAELLRTLPPTVASPMWDQLVNLGDWDGDGRADLAVSAWIRRDRSKDLMILSPSRGAVLAELPPAGGSSPESRRKIAAPGDVNGDGNADVAVLTSFVLVGGEWHSQLEAWGTASARPLWSVAIEDPPECRGAALAVVGDVDRDGVLDLGVGFPPWSNAPVVGHVQLRSGRDGHELLSFSGVETPWKFGLELARAADADGDGIEDVAVFEDYRDGFSNEVSSQDPLPRLEIVSSRTGRSIRRDQRESARRFSSWRARHIRSGADVDGDGWNDIAIRSLQNEEAVEVLSGKDGRVLHAVTPHLDPNGREEWWFPSDVSIADDVDGDGVLDLLLGHDEVGSDMGADYGAIYLQSTRTNELLLAVWGTVDDVDLGAAIAWLGDTDADGCPEFAALTTDGVRVWAVRGSN